MCDWLLSRFVYLCTVWLLLDKFGNAGYRNIFIYAAVVMVIGVINAVVTQIYKKKKLVQEV